MSQPSRPRARGPAQRRRRDLQIEQPVPLEDRRLPAPVMSLFPVTATFTAAATPTNANLGTVTVAFNTAATTPNTAAPITSISELTPNSSFGGDIVNIAAGPGGVFGKGVYAVSRGAGGDPAAIDRPGVIYRVDPATGKSSVFFDLNTVLSQTDPTNTTPASPASNSLGVSTGLVNWYNIAFDPEGKFSGNPSMFVTSSDRSDPNKNIIFQISPSGTLMGVFVQMTSGLSALKFNLNPTAILVLPQEQQRFLNGLIAGSGISLNSGTFGALFFDANAYSPGQVISNGTLPTGVSETNLGLPEVSPVLLSNSNTVGAALINTGPIVGLTAANQRHEGTFGAIELDVRRRATGAPQGGYPQPGRVGPQGIAE